MDIKSVNESFSVSDQVSLADLMAVYDKAHPKS